MGKKKNGTSYDKEILKEFVVWLNRIRRPIKEGGFTELSVNLEKLEETIKKLPKKDRESIERFWGLIPGTTAHARKFTYQVKKDSALKNMMASAVHAMEKLISIEYLRFYDEQVEEVIQNLLKKMNRNGLENLSDNDAIKYLLLFFIFIVGGEKMIYEEGENQLSIEEEKTGKFDNYSLLRMTWFGSANLLEDESINMKLLLQVIDMFDVKDVIAMKRYVGLPIEPEYSGIETEPMGTFKDIRLFKKRLFPNGPWDIATILIYSRSIDLIDCSELESNFDVFRQDWQTFRKFKTGELEITTPIETKTVDCYEIGELRFTDIYEVMTLYVNRNLF